MIDIYAINSYAIVANRKAKMHNTTSVQARIRAIEANITLQQPTPPPTQLAPQPTQPTQQPTEMRKKRLCRYVACKKL